MQPSVIGQRSTATGNVLALVGDRAEESTDPLAATVVPLRSGWHPCLDHEDLVSGSENVSLRDMVRGSLVLLSEWLVRVGTPPVLQGGDVALAGGRPLLHLVRD
jgi:hypothetical protein